MDTALDTNNNVVKKLQKIADSSGRVRRKVFADVSELKKLINELKKDIEEIKKQSVSLPPEGWRVFSDRIAM